MKVKLEQKVLQYLKNVFVKDNPDLAKFLEQDQKDRNETFLVDDDVADEIRDWAGERLEAFGFDQEYNPTEEGRILESVIDHFNRE